MNRHLRLILLLLMCSPSFLGVEIAGAQDERYLREMPYVATQVATDIFVGTVLQNFETIDSGESGRSDLFPRFDTFYLVEVGTVVKGSLDTGEEVRIRHRGGEVGGDVDYGQDDGPLEIGQRYLFVTALRDGEDYYRTTGYLDSSLLLESDVQEAEWVGRWRTAANAGECAGYLDVLRWNGTVYARRAWNDDKRFLEPEWVGDVLSTVERQDYSLYACSPDLRDGDASLLAVGTEIRELIGYAPSFRLAVRLPDKHRWLYEAVWSESAQVAEDMLGVRGHFDEVMYGRSSYCNDQGCVDYGYWPRPMDESTTALVDQLLTSPVIPQPDGLAFFPEDETGFFVFYLSDGSTAGVRLNICTGVSSNGIMVGDDVIAELMRGYGEADCQS